MYMEFFFSGRRRHTSFSSDWSSDVCSSELMCWSEIAYRQVGDNPGRREPYTGEINYRNVFKWLHNKGYKGIVGMEHGMSKSGKEGEDILVAAYREADNF